MLVWIGLSTGNFIYGAMTGASLGVALKLSFYQGVAIATYVIFNKVK